MTTLMKASNQWSSRPDDERFTSLTEMRDKMRFDRDHSRAVVVPSKQITLVPADDNQGMAVRGDKSVDYFPNHWSFGQLASLASSPAAYLRSLPSPIAADAINYKLKFARAVEDVGLLLYKNGDSQLLSANGPNYGRVWNDDVVDALISKFGDGDGDWKVPGEFGRAVEVTKENTTLFASDRDMFVFLADEQNRIEMKDRRNGRPGSLSRGFFVWNSQVGKCTLGVAMFLFDYVCCNRIVWGAQGYEEIRVRHTSSAPLKWFEEVQPLLTAYQKGSAKPFEDAIAAAQEKKIEDVKEFLANRFTAGRVESIMKIHEVEEGRPIETLWDATTAMTAYARALPHQDARVEMEREAGKVMALAA